MRPLPIRTSSRAFTLIELLVVIVILGILMAVAVPTFLKQQQKAQDSKTQQQLTNAYHAIKGDVPEAGGNQYPPLNSVVSDLRQSEPELTVSQGNCSQSSSDKQVVVDSTISSTKKVYLYAKSASGTTWSLTAPATGASTLRALPSCAGPLLTSTLTSFTNAVTDTTRASGSAADGLSNDSSFGIWPTSTNLIQNGGFETGTAGGWLNDVTGGGAVTVTQDTSTAAVGSSSMKVVAAGGGTQEGVRYGQSPLLALSANTTYSASVWLKGSGYVGAFLDLYDSTPAYVTSVGYTYNPTGVINLTSSWQRYTFTFTTGSTVASGRFSIRTQSPSLTAQATTFWIDGVQVEQQGAAGPYIDTSSGTATRTGGSAVISTAALNTTQGWVAVRLRPEWASSGGAAVSSGTPGIFEWQDSNNTRIGTYYNAGANTFTCFRQNNGGPSVNILVGTFSKGQSLTMICKWDANNVGASANGSSFLTAPNTTIPTLVSTSLSIGTILGGSRQWSGEILWVAAGTGTLSDSDAATINSFGDTDPTPQQFSVAAQDKLVWTADNSTVITP